MRVELSDLVVAEALDALLTRVRWYVSRGYGVPEQVALAFNRFCDIANVLDDGAYKRLRPHAGGWR